MLPIYISWWRLRASCWTHIWLRRPIELLKPIRPVFDFVPLPWQEAHRHNPTRCVGPIAQFPYQVGSKYYPATWGAWVKLMEPGKRTYRLPAWKFVRFLMRAARAPAAGISRSPGGTWSHANIIITWTSDPGSSFRHSRPSASLALSLPSDDIHLVQRSILHVL